MVVKKRKKVTRLRGSRTHGWGVQHRNSGQRGGAGNAGSGKKSDCKKPSNWGDPSYFGKHGFKQKGPTIEEKPINFRDIEDKLQGWVDKKLVSQEKDSFVVDLDKLGYNKLLSTGRITRKLRITVPYASASVAEKLKQAGGELVQVKKK